MIAGLENTSFLMHRASWMDLAFGMPVILGMMMDRYDGLSRMHLDYWMSKDRVSRISVSKYLNFFFFALSCLIDRLNPFRILGVTGTIRQLDEVDYIALLKGHSASEDSELELVNERDESPSIPPNKLRLSP